MKKTIKSLLAIAIAAFAFTACSDVPEPYQIPGSSSGGGDTPEGTYVSESFETSFGSFTVKTIKGTPWVIDFKTAKATGYDGSATTASEAYLVSSPIDLSQSKGAYLEFDYILRYVKAGQTENKVLVTSNYTGDPATTKWTDITGTLTEGKDWNTFSKYQSNLPAAMIGQSTVVIAFYYSCTTSSSTIEIKNLKVIEGNVGESSGKTTKAIEVTCAEAVTATNNLADNATSTETYAVTGYITTVVGNVSNNQQTFWMADTKDGGKVFEAYWANLPSGVSAFTVGMKVKITGNLIKYVKNGAVTPEIKNATVEILEGGNDTGGETGGGDSGAYGTLNGNVLTLNCAGLGLENNPASIALVDGTTITLAKNDGNNNPAYNGSFGELRFYARNSFTINAGSKTIASVKLYCTLHNDNPGVGNDGEVTASSGTLDIQKEAMTIQATSVNNSSFTLTNGYAAKNSGGIQIRFNKMEITYAQ